MPVSVGDTIIGVICMDIDFDILIENISTKKLYDSGHAFLIGTDGSVLDKDSVRHASSSKIAIEEVDKFRKNLTEKESMDLIAYTYNGIHKRMVYSRLNNNMYLVFVADDSDIYEEQHFLLNLPEDKRSAR